MRKSPSRLLCAFTPITGICGLFSVQLATHATKIRLTHTEWLTYGALILCLFLMQSLSLVPMLHTIRADRHLGSGQLKLSW
jgi:hypothetical protein